MIFGGQANAGLMTPAPTESPPQVALGHRTVLLHVEIKRLRAWWRKILRHNLLQRLAGHTLVQVTL